MALVLWCSNTQRYCWYCLSHHTLGYLSLRFILFSVTFCHRMNLCNFTGFIAYLFSKNMLLLWKNMSLLQCVPYNVQMLEERGVLRNNHNNKHGMEDQRFSNYIYIHCIHFNCSSTPPAHTHTHTQPNSKTRNPILKSKLSWQTVSFLRTCSAYNN